MENKMDIQVAFNNIVIVVRDFKGTWQQHQDLDRSLSAIQDALNASRVPSLPPPPAQPSLSLVPDETADGV